MADALALSVSAAGFQSSPPKHVTASLTALHRSANRSASSPNIRVRAVRGDALPVSSDAYGFGGVAAGALPGAGAAVFAAR